MNRFTLINKRAMAYIIMPLLFSTIGYTVLYFAFAPVLRPVVSSLNLIISDNKPGYSSRIESIFKENNSGDQSITTVDEKLVEMPTYGTHYARLEIEAAEIVTDLYFGDSSAVLKKGVGQYFGSTIPGYGRPLLIGGHSNGQFNKLQYVKAGNIVTITTNYGIYEYEVTETKILYAFDKSAYNLSQQKEQLILYTCYPFNTLGLTSKRFFVYGDKISGPVITSPQ
ncbi:MAG: class D sortase [Oscillospiraceae bacterium]|nr:class D sortase [Oscillospiraceae bacterium]MDD4414884.1 class D sortase [Oscillospiraceae bacterium]